MNSRLLGFDFGLKRIGTATGNLDTGTSQSLKTLPARDGVPAWSQVAALIDEWRPARLVVGLPLNMDGSDSPMSNRARTFARQLERNFELPVSLVDERLSTVTAEALLEESTAAGKAIGKKRGKIRDSLAAELILRTYIEDNRVNA